jgi:hypothetical protein
MNPLAIISLLLPALALCDHSILTFGAQPGTLQENTTLAFINSYAMQQAISAANASDTDRTVLIPANYSFLMMPVSAVGIYNVTFKVDGMVYAS